MSFARREVAVEIGDHVELAAAGAHFLQIGLELLEERIVGRDRDDGHLGVDQRERAVLQLTGGVGFGVDVRDLLQLERALERDRIVEPAPEEQRVLLFREALRPRDHLRLERERRLQRRRQMAKPAQPVRFFLGRQPRRAAWRA